MFWHSAGWHQEAWSPSTMRGLEACAWMAAPHQAAASKPLIQVLGMWPSRMPLSLPWVPEVMGQQSVKNWCSIFLDVKLSLLYCKEFPCNSLGSSTYPLSAISAQVCEKAKIRDCCWYVCSYPSTVLVFLVFNHWNLTSKIEHRRWSNARRPCISMGSCWSSHFAAGAVACWSMAPQ